MDIMDWVSACTGGRVRIGAGTLYNLLEQFCDAGMIVLTRIEGRRRSYRMTSKGAKPCKRNTSGYVVRRRTSGASWKRRKHHEKPPFSFTIFQLLRFGRHGPSFGKNGRPWLMLEKMTTFGWHYRRMGAETAAVYCDISRHLFVF